MNETNKNNRNEDSNTLFPGIMMVTNYIYGMTDAYQSAKKINQRSAFDSGTPSPKLSFSVTSIGKKSLGIQTTVRF